MKGDIIKDLPTDDTTPLSDDEEYMYTNVFLNDLTQTQNKNPKLMIFIQSFLICMGLFILLNVPQLETVLRSVSSIMSNNWVFIIFKAFLFTATFFTIENFHLGRDTKVVKGSSSSVKKDKNKKK
jgi:hypothetical protein